MPVKNTPKKRLHQRIAHRAKHWFIPHEGNDHKPHALRPKALRAYAYILITAKVASVIFLFAAFPNAASFAAFTSQTIISLTNTSRTQSGLSALKENSLLDQAALRKANDMIARDYFAHTTPDGKRFWTWIDGVGYDYTLAGENLAVDFTTPEAAHAALMASPTHRANIMNSRYKEMGVAVVTGTLDGASTTLLVEMFGTPTAKKTATAKVTTVQAKPKPTTTTKPTVPTTPKVKAAETPPPTGTLTQQSLESFTFETGATITVWAEFKNTGAQPWKAGDLTLQTVEPAKHASTFHNDSWTSTTVVGALQADVPTQSIERFEWKFTAPTTTGTTTEHLALVDAGGTMLTGTEVSFTITVATPAILAQTTPTPTQTDLGNPAPSTAPEVTPVPTTSTSHDWVSRIVAFSDRFYLGFLFFLGIALLLNIIIKFRVQHIHLISQTVAVILIASAGLLLKFHFFEKLAPLVKVLGS